MTVSYVITVNACFLVLLFSNIIVILKLSNHREWYKQQKHNNNNYTALPGVNKYIHTLIRISDFFEVFVSELKFSNHLCFTKEAADNKSTN